MKMQELKEYLKKFCKREYGPHEQLFTEDRFTFYSIASGGLYPSNGGPVVKIYDNKVWIEFNNGEKFELRLVDD